MKEKEERLIQSEREKVAIEREKVAIERAKVAIEREKVALEREKIALQDRYVRLRNEKAAAEDQLDALNDMRPKKLKIIEHKPEEFHVSHCQTDGGLSGNVIRIFVFKNPQDVRSKVRAHFNKPGQAPGPFAAHELPALYQFLRQQDVIDEYVPE